MAEIHRFINTASAGGDGTTNGTSGATAAYASLSSWEANEIVPTLDTFLVDCCGTAADPTAADVDASGGDIGGLTIRGNRSDPAGFYDGPLAISDQHYRLAPGDAAACLTLSDAGTAGCVIDGIQIVSGHTGTGGNALACGATGRVHTIRKCRLLNAANCERGIANNNNENSTIENNLVVGFKTAGISATAASGSGTKTWRHNTVYGDGIASHGLHIQKTSGSSNWTALFTGNAIANNGGNDINVVTVDGDITQSLADNATEDLTGNVTGIVPADVWTSPGITASAEFTVKNTSSAIYQVVSPTMVADDIAEFTRDGASHDAGAFEFQAGGAVVITAGTLAATGRDLAADLGAAVAAGTLAPAGRALVTALTAALAAGDLTLNGQALDTGTLEAIAAGVLDLAGSEAAVTQHTLAALVAGVLALRGWDLAVAGADADLVTITRAVARAIVRAVAGSPFRRFE